MGHVVRLNDDSASINCAVSVVVGVHSVPHARGVAERSDNSFSAAGA